MLGIEPWFLNFTQFVPRAQDVATLQDVPRPYLEYAIFGAIKGAEMATLIGGLILHPTLRHYWTARLVPETTTTNSHKIIRNKCRRMQGRLLIAGLLVGPTTALLSIPARNLSEEEVKRRCYEIRIDALSMTVDRGALLGGLVGWYWRRFQGMVDGINLGIGLALANNYIVHGTRYYPRILRDRIKPDEVPTEWHDPREKDAPLKRWLYNRQSREEDSSQEKSTAV